MRKIGFIALLVSLVLPLTLSAQDDLKIARIKYDGGGDWYGDEDSVHELLKFVNANTTLRIEDKEDIVDLDSDKLFTYPYVYLTGHGNVSFSLEQAGRLRRYLERGGFLHIDDNYGMDQHIRREMKKVFPDSEWAELPFSHPIYSVHFQFASGLPKIHEHDGKAAQGFGLFHEDRLVAFYSFESDLGDGWEPEDVHENPADLRQKALEMGTNIIVFAFLRPDLN